MYISNFLLHSPPHFPQFLILYFYQDPIDCMSNFLRRRPSHHFLARSKGLPIKMSSYWRGGSVRKCDSFVKGRVSNYVWRHIYQHCIHFTYLGLVHFFLYFIIFSLFSHFYCQTLIVSHLILVSCTKRKCKIPTTRKLLINKANATTICLC